MKDFKEALQQAALNLVPEYAAQKAEELENLAAFAKQLESGLPKGEGLVTPICDTWQKDFPVIIDKILTENPSASVRYNPLYGWCLHSGVIE